jgi:hypothetical protein
MIILTNVVSCSLIFDLQKSWNNKSQSYNDKDNSKPYILAIEIRVPMAVSQENTTNETATTNTTATSTTTTESTNAIDETDTTDLPSWNPYLVDENLYYPLALVCSILGILSTLWLIFFVETSKDRTIRERIIGSSVRLIFMSLFLGLSLHFWILFEPI